MDYKAFPGHPDNFPVAFKRVIGYMLEHGLTEDSKLLDIGCGPLRLGRYLILFLRPHCYFGLEPEKEMVREGRKKELIPEYGRKLVDYKSPTFRYNSNFDLSTFGVMFDIVLASQVFVHCSTDQLRQCLKSVRDNLQSDGKFFLHVNIGDEYYVSEKAHKKYKYADTSWVVYPEGMFCDVVSQHGYNAQRLHDKFWCLTHQGVS